MLFRSSNNIGIGVLPSGTYKLEISGNVGATAYYETSDIRFKNVIETNPNIDLSSIDVIKYTALDDDVIRYGYSAQQVKSACEDLARGDEKLTINYSDIHTLKIKALEDKVKLLEEKLKELEEKLSNK